MKYIIEVEIPDGETMDVQKPGLGFKGFVYVKAEQVEDAGDQISRQAVLNLIDGWTYDLCDKEDEWKAAEEIENLPSAQERKKGEWEVAIGYDHNKKVMCTNCQLMSYEPTPFCPHCGADMRGEEDAKEKF